MLCGIRKMFIIGHLGAYDKNFGDNVAIRNVRVALDELMDEEIVWKPIDLLTIHKPGKDKRWYISIFKEISQRYDMLIIGGGGMIQDYVCDEHEMSWNMPFDDEILSVIDIPIVCVSLGINLFRGLPGLKPSTLKNLKSLIDKSRLFSLRNDGSYEIFKKLDLKTESAVYETPDPGLIFGEQYMVPRKSVMSRGALQPVWNGRREINGSRFGKYFHIMRDRVEKIRSLIIKNDLKILEHTPKDANMHMLDFETDVTYTIDGTLFCFENQLITVRYYHEIDFSVAMRGHGQMVAIALNVPSLYFSTQAKVEDFSLKNGFADYNVDIHDDDWYEKLNNKIIRLQNDKEYLHNWYEIRDKFVLQCKRDFYEYCNKIKALLQELKKE